jgi:hypothetical protein
MDNVARPKGSAAPFAIKENAPPVAIAVAAVSLVAFVGWLAYANLFGPPKMPYVAPQARQRLDEWDALAKKSHGDISQLSPAERDKFLRESGGFGAEILHGWAKKRGY